MAYLFQEDGDMSDPKKKSLSQLPVAFYSLSFDPSEIFDPFDQFDTFIRSSNFFVEVSNVR